MKAIVQDRYGLPDVLELREVDRPEPARDEVCVEVRAASLNMYDWHMTTGYPFLARLVAGLRAPEHPIPGADVAGTVVAVGAEVTRFRPGDEVFAFVGYGAFAEYVCAAETRFVRRPAEVSFEEAAATPLAGITALEGLRDVGGLRADQRVLINGASGGVGTFAVQIAKALGAEVTAVCSTSKVELVASIGADRVVDYTQEDFARTERGYDVLFDNVGDRPWSQTRRVLSPTGIHVTVTGPKHRWAGPLRAFVLRKVQSQFDPRTMTWFTAAMKREHLEELADLLASAEVKPVIEETYPLEKTAEAMRYLGEGHAAGKLIIRM
ncbi:MAG TPA: NAD(P)-dependent alcohol dehydrogenase [Acidimicrobiia bacterium]|nr:NAD(P)-dependent alcohol dehydrogenase [Acidimicrobiia bacterium]